MSIAPLGGCAPAWVAWYSRPSFPTRSAILATSSRMRRPRQQQASIACITNRERRSVQLVQERRQILARSVTHLTHRCPLPRRLSVEKQTRCYATASLTAFTGRARITFLAGLALNIVGS